MPTPLVGLLYVCFWTIAFFYPRAINDANSLVFLI